MVFISMVHIPIKMNEIIQNAVLCFVIFAGISVQAAAQQVDTGKSGNLKFVPFSIDSTRIKTPKGAMYRSLAIPGWGQWYNGNKYKSAVIFTAETGCAAGYFIQNHRLSNSKIPQEREYYRGDRNKYAWWFIGIILYSVLDAYVDAYLHDFDRDMFVKNDNQFTIPIITVKMDISSMKLYNGRR